MNNENKKKAKNETSYMAIGMCLGMCFGAALGLVLFHNLVIGMSTGMCIGICIGLVADSEKKKATSKEANQHDFVRNRQKKEEGEDKEC